MNVTIVGSGHVGQALAGGWCKAGHGVTFATREPDGAKAAELKRRGFRVVPLDSAASSADVIVLAVPWSAVAATIEGLGPLAGKVLIDATDPLKSTRELAVGFDDSGGETVARLSGARVVKAFSTTGAGNMADSSYPGGRPMMAVAGEDAPAKQIAMALAADLGFDPVDTGPLAMCRYLEPLAMLWINLAYTQGIGPNIAFALLRR
jgi:8-hydroxy-5-deazaflavin:NADPH oxidoreductase